MRKQFYEITYRYFRPTWESDVYKKANLVPLVESGRIKPGRAIDLGCGSGENVVYLARKGFEVVGVDYAEAGIEKARARAKEAGARAEFIVDDLTNLRHVSGTFDFLLDFGTLDDLDSHQRDLYFQNVLPLTHSGSHFLLWGFEYPMRCGRSSYLSSATPSTPERSNSASAGISKSRRLRVNLTIRNGHRATQSIS